MKGDFAFIMPQSLHPATDNPMSGDFAKESACVADCRACFSDNRALNVSFLGSIGYLSVKI
jgi:hypothetical protein